MTKKMKFDDLVEVLSPNSESSIREVFSCRSGRTSLTMEQACKIFPDLKDSSGESVIYVPVSMAHSVPSVNSKGRAFSEAVLRSSASGLQDSLVNEEHDMSSQYLGHIRTAVFNPVELREAASCLFDPHEDEGSIGKPLIALTALYLRNPKVSSMVSEHASGDLWYVSMECLHNLRDAAAYYGGEFIPLIDAPEDMLACIGKDSVVPYKGRELAIALGGESGSVRFDALAFTKTPADANGDVLGFYTPRNDGKKLFPGISMSATASREAASFSEDLINIVNREEAAVEIIGQTDPAADGHTHDVASTLDVMITNGHSHYLQRTSLDVGNKPTLTGLTSEHSIWDDMGNQLALHIHLINIPLKAKKASPAGTVDLASRDAASKQGDLTVAKLLEKMRELGSRLDKLTAGKQTDDGNKDMLVIARELSSLDLDEALKEAIAEQVKAGDLVTKGDVEKKVKEASDEAVISFKKHADIISSREKQVEDIGIDLAHVISGEGDSEVTVKDFVGSFATDDDGSKQFASQIAVMSSLVPKTDLTDSEKKNIADAKAKKEGEDREAASKGILKIVGAGDTSSKREISSLDQKKKTGRFAFTG